MAHGTYFSGDSLPNCNLLTRYPIRFHRAERERFIIAKYVKKEFINEGEDMKEFVSRSVHEAFWAAMDASDYCEALRCLALGANVDHHNDDHGSMTALHRAIARRDDIAVEFLYQWFCDINITDGQGWTAMHHAVSVGNTKVITTLIKRHAKYDIRNRNGEVSYTELNIHHRLSCIMSTGPVLLRRIIS